VHSSADVHILLLLCKLSCCTLQSPVAAWPTAAVYTLLLHCSISSCCMTYRCCEHHSVSVSTLLLPCTFSCCCVYIFRCTPSSDSDTELCHHIQLLHDISNEIYKTIISPVVLYGCEAWSLTLRKRHKLRFSRNCWVFGPCSSSHIPKNTTKQSFGIWICFRPQVTGETITLLCPLRKANLNHWH
jgi:hypothetical protein